MVEPMKKIIRNILFTLAACLLAASCDTRAAYNTEGVVIDMNIIQLRSGFCEVEFTPSSDAWYYVDVKPVSNMDPRVYKTEFMSLALDEAYMKYIEWRHGQLVQHAPYVADFASHSLRYRNTCDYFYYLEPDTDYWLFAFVVDPKTNEPCGDLFCQTIHTSPKSDIDVTLLYKVSGSWDYGYPLDKKTGSLTTDVPWIGITYDSEDIADEMACMTPDQFFGRCYDQLVEHRNANIFRGIYAHENNGLGDGTSRTVYKEGHTYYICMAVFDGKFSQHVIYKFTWTKDIELTFVPDDSLSDQW